MAEDRRDDRRGLDHEGDRSDEIAENFGKKAPFLFDDRIRSVVVETLFSFGVRKPLARVDLELGEDLSDRDLFQIGARFSGRCIRYSWTVSRYGAHRARS